MEDVTVGGSGTSAPKATRADTDAPRFEALDGLRGIAALAVVFYHIGLITAVTGPFAHGYLFVDLFFLLSGFVIAKAYERRFDAGMGLWPFMKLRLIRLYPMIALGTVLGLGATIAGLQPVPHAVVAVILQLLFIPNLWRGEQIYPLNPVQWSLLFELIVNAAHAVVLRHLNIRQLMVLIALSVAGLLWAAASFHSLSGGFGKDNWWFGVPRVFFSYTVGIVLYRLHAQSRLPRIAGPWWCWLGVALLSVVATTIPMARFGSLKDVLVVTLVFPALITAAVPMTLPPGVSAWAEKLGNLSYPIYAIHLPILLCIAAFGGQTNGPGYIALWSGGMLAILLAGWITLKVYDEPLRNAIAARRQRRSA